MTSSRKYKCPLCHRCHRHRLGHRLRNMFTNKSTPPPLPQSPPQLLPPVDHPFSDRMRPLHEWEICPLSNGKICSLPRENFFSHQRKNSRCPARWALPRHRPPAPCKHMLQSHATPPHMREEEQCEKSQQTTLPPPFPTMTMTPMTMGFARNRYPVPAVSGFAIVRQ